MIYGMMLDAGRVIERHEFYFKLIPHLARWGYNTLFWHFSDNEQCALRFDSEPELGSRHALSVAETKKLVRHAKKYNINVIPELESLGHTKYITDVPKFRDLAELIFSHHHATLCSEHPGTLALMQKLLGETMDIFDSEYIHAGLDEAIFDSACQRCSPKRAFDGVEGLVADYIRKIHAVLAARDRKMMIWADMILKRKKILDMIPKDIVLCNWVYGGELDVKEIRSMTDKGFKVINCPSITPAVMQDGLRLDNVRNHIETSRKFPKNEVIGVMNTSWEGWRYLQGAIIPGMAVAGKILATGGNEPADFIFDFTREYFGCVSAKSVQAVGSALQAAFAKEFGYSDLNALCPACELDFRCLNPKNMAKYKRNVKLYRKILAVLKKEEKNVVANKRHYKDIVVSVETILRLSAFAPFIRELTGNLKSGKAANPKKIKAFTGTCRTLYEKCVESWNATRYPDDPRRDQAQDKYQYNESLIYHLRAAGEFVGKMKSKANIQS